MNSVFLDGKVFGYGRHGGIGRMHYEVIKGVSPQLAMTLFHGLYIDGYDWDQATLVDDIGRNWQWAFKGSARARELLERFWLDRAWNSFSGSRNSIYHSSYYRLPNNMNGQKLLVSDFDCVHERYPELFSNAGSVIQMKKQALEKADLIATISQSSKEDLMHFHQIVEEKIRVVHLGVSNSFFPSKDKQNTEKCYLLYVGSRASYKNYNLLEEIFINGDIKGYDLLVVGGENELPTRFIGGGNVIRWCRASDDELRSIYQQAAAFIYPSLYEGFGIPPLEALACGCPVVASDISVLHEVLGDVVEYFDPLSKASLLDAINQAINHKDVNINQRVKHAEKFTWKRTSDAFLDIYQELG